MEITRTEYPQSEYSRGHGVKGLPQEIARLVEAIPTVVDAGVYLAGYQVTRVTTGQYDGHPASLFTLADSFGDREVGQLKVRHDAGREGLLEVVVDLDDGASFDTFRAWVWDEGDVPVGWRRGLARQLEPGQTVCLMTDGRWEQTTVITHELTVEAGKGGRPTGRVLAVVNNTRALEPDETVLVQV